MWIFLTVNVLFEFLIRCRSSLLYRANQCSVLFRRLVSCRVPVTVLKSEEKDDQNYAQEAFTQAARWQSLGQLSFIPGQWTCTTSSWISYQKNLLVIVFDIYFDNSRSQRQHLPVCGDSSACQSVDLLDVTNPSSNTSNELCEFYRNLSRETLCHPRRLCVDGEARGGHSNDSESEDDALSDVTRTYRRHEKYQRLKLYNHGTDCRFCRLLQSLL